MPEQQEQKSAHREAVTLAQMLQADGLPGVFISGQRPWRDSANEALVHLARAQTQVYVRQGRLVRIMRTEDGTPAIETMTETALKGTLARRVNFVKFAPGSRSLQHIAPPDNVVKDMLERDELPFPPLEAIIEFPVLRPDGTLIDTPGYDTTTRLLYLPSPQLRIPPIPDAPTWDEVMAAWALIDEALGEFPYQDTASYMNAVALLLTPLIRQAIGGHVPLALIDATRPGTGKTLLAETVAMIATGRKASLMAAPYDDDEWRKRIAATLAKGPTIIVIDNIRSGSKLQASSLDLALTSHFFEERILGESRMVRYPQRATWMATGNNIQLGGDIPRRCYWIRLDAKTADPWTRGGFQHDLEAWVPEHRGALIAALLTLARAWYVAGKPAALLPKVGSFQEWVDTVGGILAYTGPSGFLGNLEELYEQADEDAAQWAAFLRAWQKHYQDREVLTADVEKDVKAGALDNALTGLDLYNALPDELTPIDRGSFKRRLGKALAARIGSQFDESGLHMVRVRADSRSGAFYWKVAGVQKCEMEMPLKEGFENASPTPLKSLGRGIEGVIPAEENVEDGGIKPVKPAHLQKELTLSTSEAADEYGRRWWHIGIFDYVTTPRGNGMVCRNWPQQVGVVLDATGQVTYFEQPDEITRIQKTARPDAGLANRSDVILELLLGSEEDIDPLAKETYYLGPQDWPYRDPEMSEAHLVEHGYRTRRELGYPFPVAAWKDKQGEAS